MTAWHEANQRYLTAAVNVLRGVLAGRDEPEARKALAAARRALPEPAALDVLSTSFALTPFERDVALLCAAVELDASFSDLLDGRPTFGLALASLPGAHWSALRPDGALRRWQLVALDPGETLATRPLRLEERVLHYLAGVNSREARLTGLVRRLNPPAELPPAHAALAEHAAAVWAREDLEHPPPVLELCGEDVDALRDVAAAACKRAGIALHALAAEDVPLHVAEREELARLWERESVLDATALLVEHDDVPDESKRAARAFVASAGALVLTGGREPLAASRRAIVRLDVPRPSRRERRAAWERALDGLAGTLNGDLDELVEEFGLGSAGVASVRADVIARCAAGDGPPAKLLRDACRVQARPRLDGLAQRLEPRVGWGDLVLPDGELRVLHEIAAHVRRRTTVYETWGFGRSGRGLGISALFCGPSGTGKTLAAEVLAAELAFDLYRIDLSSVVSKYIGETEKNLRRVFAAAERGGAILLFDEADALFGKRSEVRDSHDRYANIEVGYLLQRMESYRGLAVLTTNAKSALDASFLRRIRFVVQFPFPDQAQRREIWRQIFPAETPTEGLELERLAQLNVPGGNIRNIALNGAFVAADEGQPVRMRHLLRAARGEYAKLERPLTAAELGGWR